MTPADPLTRIDGLMTALAGGLGALCAWLLSAQLAFTTSHLDVWFESDSVYVLSQLTDRHSEHNDTNSRHPLYPVVGFGAVVALERGLLLDRVDAARIVLVTSGGLFTAAAFLALRLLSRPRMVAVAGTLALVLASPGVLFLGIHERLIPGGITCLVCVIAAAACRRGLAASRWLPIAAATSLGVTVTNFMTGGFLLLAGLGWRRGLRGMAVAYAIVQVVTLVTVLTFPASTTFPHMRVWRMSSIWSDYDDILRRAGTWGQKSRAFWMHAVVMPEPARQEKLIAEPPMSYLTLQTVSLDRHRWPGWAALGLWLAGLGAGLAHSLRARDPVAHALVAALVAQWGLFSVFGEETVLYAAYYVPLAVLVASQGVASAWADRRVRAATVAFVILLAWNNLDVFVRARAAALALL